MKPDKEKDRKISSESSTRYTVSRLEFIRLKLHRGDKKVIAEILNLHPEWVSQVIRGKGNSEVILEEAERIIFQREAEEREKLKEQSPDEKKKTRKRKKATEESPENKERKPRKQNKIEKKRTPGENYESKEDDQAGDQAADRARNEQKSKGRSKR